MMGNITFVKDSTTLQLCGSFIFKSNKTKISSQSVLSGFIVLCWSCHIHQCWSPGSRGSWHPMAKRVFGLGTERPARLHTQPGEGTSVHSLSPNLGLISSKDVQIKAGPGTFYQASPPSIWSQTNREPTRFHVSKRSTWRHKLSLKDNHKRSQLFHFCVLWSWFILSLICRF